MNDVNNLATFLSDGWLHIMQGISKSDAPARFPTFATVAPNGEPEARTVALRHADRKSNIIEVYTDITTPKVTSLRKTPLAAVHVWVPKAQMQIRLTTKVKILTGTKTNAKWDKVPLESRVSYGTTPTPGSPIPHVHAYEKPAHQHFFAALQCHITHIDLVHLDTRHRRASFSYEDNWQGTWLSP